MFYNIATQLISYVRLNSKKRELHTEFTYEEYTISVFKNDLLYYIFFRWNVQLVPDMWQLVPKPKPCLVNHFLLGFELNHRKWFEFNLENRSNKSDFNPQLLPSVFSLDFIGRKNVVLKLNSIWKVLRAASIVALNKDLHLICLLVKCRFVKQSNFTNFF